MTRTKWMRLVVRDPADVLRWASQQDARQRDAFRRATAWLAAARPPQAPHSADLYRFPTAQRSSTSQR
jgi:hypothetical protein